MINNKLYKLHSDGKKFIIFALVGMAIGLFISNIVSQIFFLFFLFFLIFFRNPNRKTPNINGAIFSPGDGIVKIVQTSKLPEEISHIADSATSWEKISIFLSVFDVHVNRIPISGYIKETFYKKGAFQNAINNTSSEKNESQYVVISNNDHDIICQQIAGLIARRIVCYSKKGDKVEAGKEYGIIRFGSRIDIYYPSNLYKSLVKPGEFVKGGESIIATLIN